MRWKPSAAATREADPIRFAWWASFFATLALVAILGFAKSAQALTVPTADGAGKVVALALPSDEEEDEAETSEDEGTETEECESDEEECEEEARSEAPADCLLSSARATIFATPNRDKVRLQVRYMTSSPIAVDVDYGLHGSKGSLFLGGGSKRLAGTGVLRFTRHVSEAQMAKVMAAKGFTVRLRVPAAPRYCQALFDRQLNVRQATPSGLAWRQSE